MPSPDTPTRKLAAIMFTDIAGYTAQMSKDESKALSLLKTKESILKPLIKKHNGTYVKSTVKALGFKGKVLTIKGLRSTYGIRRVTITGDVFQVSREMGHRSVTTTEKHYAPLFATDVEEFVL